VSTSVKGMQLLPELVEFLVKHKYIYTVRRYRYSLLDHSINIEGAGPCERVHIVQISRKEDLGEYVYKSGFDSVDIWWKQIKRFSKGYVGPYYLYEITTEEEAN